MSRSILPALLAVALAVPGVAGEDPTITRVEEDWVVFIRNPDADAGAPQITNILAPAASPKRAWAMRRTSKMNTRGTLSTERWCLGTTTGSWKSTCIPI